MDIIAGRDFSNIDEEDFEKTLLTVSATRALGYATPEEAVGKSFIQHHIRGYTQTWEIIGIVEDFHYESLQRPIRPAFVQKFEPRGFWLVVRLRGDIRAGLASLKSTWSQFVPHLPVQPVFLDQEYARYYQSEERLSRALTWVSALAIAVACVGILALAANAAEQRAKEVGIRKALGSTVTGVVRLLSTDFVKLVVVACMVACPIAWYGVDQWLAGYAYRVDVGWQPFVLAGTLVSCVAVMAVAAQTLRAALANPVDALRCE
jgi:putative ABC transport system permease protein